MSEPATVAPQASPRVGGTPCARSLADRLRAVRQRSLALAAPLSDEDQCVQSMADASPTKWHLAHTSWFFETLVLRPHCSGYRVFDERFGFLFNSYYEALGARHPRPQRGVLTRPSAAEVRRYRAHVDAALLPLVERLPADDAADGGLRALVELGLQHEQQHQELMLTDILHLLSCNPLAPAYADEPVMPMALAASTRAARWLGCTGGIVPIGHDARDGFCFDNELPRHEVLLRPYEIASQPVRCGEYLEFVRAGGYDDPRWWLSDGWAARQAGGWTMPPYWRAAAQPGAAPLQFTLEGLRPLDAGLAVDAISFYEASAYAAWRGARLPTEFEWEAALRQHGAAVDGVGEVWEWTRSSYDPYPGFVPLPGAVGEYNGKFMVGQLVLRGGSRATPPGHWRPSYRNFFPPAARWQWSGLRLARDVA